MPFRALLPPTCVALALLADGGATAAPEGDVCQDVVCGGVSLLQTKVAVQPFAVAGDHAGQDGLPWPEACVVNYSQGLDDVRAGLGDDMRRQMLLQRNVQVNSTQRSVIFGVGSGTTGTHSLAEALSLFNLTGWHYFDDAADDERNWTRDLVRLLYNNDNKTSAVDCHAHLQGFDYTALPDDVQFVADDPVDQVFLHLFAAFPNAKFILTTRPAMEWAASRRENHDSSTLVPMQDPCANASLADFPANEDLGRIMELQDRLIRCVVPKAQLLEFDLFADPVERRANLMQEVADFLERPLPAVEADPLFQDSTSTMYVHLTAIVVVAVVATAVVWWQWRWSGCA